MGRRSKNEGDLPPFIAVIKTTLAEPAWLDLGYGARCLYITLKGFHNGQNNGRIYLSVRKAAKEMGASTSAVENWFVELQNHGFIVMTKAGYLGTDGKGMARYWRLTELGIVEIGTNGRKSEGTKDYRKWPQLPQLPIPSKAKKNKTPSQ